MDCQRLDSLANLIHDYETLLATSAKSGKRESRPDNSSGFKMDTKVGMTGICSAKYQSGWCIARNLLLKNIEKRYVPCSIANIEYTLLLFGWLHRNSGWATFFCFAMDSIYLGPSWQTDKNVFFKGNRRKQGLALQNQNLGVQILELPYSLLLRNSLC